MPRHPNPTRREFTRRVASFAMIGALPAAGLGTSQRAWSQTSTETAMQGVKALIFDVFGTLVDWRTCVARESRTILEPLG